MKKNIIKVFIDVTILILYVLLMFADGLGSFFHETVGIGIGILFLIHIVLNRSMIKGLFSSLKNEKSGLSKRFLLASDIALTVCMSIVILTGVLIAKELFVINSDISWELLFNIHNVLSYVCLGIMLLHTLLHEKYLVGVFKKFPSAISGGEVKYALCRFSAGAAAAVVLYSSLTVFKTISDKQEYPENSHDNSRETFSETADESERCNNTQIGSSVTSDEYGSSISEISGAGISISQPAPTSTPTLEEYLSGLVCTGCGKRCSLLHPRCGKGEMRAVTAKQQYYQTYSE
ncbi:MAG: DUF4405 domain-containing protein [Oscillospiraceae bacterium]